MLPSLLGHKARWRLLAAPPLSGGRSKECSRSSPGLESRWLVAKPQGNCEQDEAVVAGCRPVVWVWRKGDWEGEASLSFRMGASKLAEIPAGFAHCFKTLLLLIDITASDITVPDITAPIPQHQMSLFQHYCSCCDITAPS